MSAFTVPKLLFLAGLGHQSKAQTGMLYVASQQGSNADAGIHSQASRMLTGMSLGLLSQLVMTNAAADAFVVQQANCCSTLWACLACSAICHTYTSWGTLFNRLKVFSVKNGFWK